MSSFTLQPSTTQIPDEPKREDNIMGNLRQIKTEAHKEKRDKVNALLNKFNKLQTAYTKLYARNSFSYEFTLEAIQDKMFAIINELRADQLEDKVLIPMDTLNDMLLDLIAIRWGMTGKDILDGKASGKGKKGVK